MFKSQAENFTDQIGLPRVDSLSSEAGVPVFTDHEYEVVSTYNNPSDEDQDSMAVMYVYLLDHDFQPPALSPDRRPDGRRVGVAPAVPVFAGHWHTECDLRH